MAMDDLADLFNGIDGLADDLLEYGTMAGAAVATMAGYAYGVTALASLWPTQPDWVKKYATPAAAILLGGAGVPMLASHFKPLRGRFASKAAAGVATGLVASGIIALAKQFMPTLPFNGLGASEDTVLLGLGATQQDLYQKYLGSAPVTVEQVRGLGAASVTVEQVRGDLGSAPVTVEQVAGFNSFGAVGVESAFS